MIDKITAGDNFPGTITVVGNTTRIIEDGIKYRVNEDPDGIYRSIVYNDVTYEVNDVFTGTTETVYTGDAEFSTVIDITNWEFYITVKRLETDSDANALLKYHLTDISSPTEGEAVFDIPALEWDDFTAGKALIELKWKDANDDIYTFETKTPFIIEASLLNEL
jgi:hypothetical protein